MGARVREFLRRGVAFITGAGEVNPGDDSDSLESRALVAGEGERKRR